MELAPLHMQRRAEPYEFPELSRATFYGLPALLADALPDAFGNALVDASLAEQGVAATDITPLDRLSYAADRAMGALEFRPPARPEGEDPPTGVALADLVLAARRTVEGVFDRDETAKAALRQLISVGTSAGGARAKAVVAYNPATSQVRSAYSAPAPGFEQWLIKLDGVGGTAMDGHERPARRERSLREDRVRVLGDGAGRRAGDDGVQAPRRRPSAPFHDEAVRPWTRRRAHPRDLAVRTGSSRFQHDRRPQLRPVPPGGGRTRPRPRRARRGLPPHGVQRLRREPRRPHQERRLRVPRRPGRGSCHRPTTSPTPTTPRAGGRAGT